MEQVAESSSAGSTNAPPPLECAPVMPELQLLLETLTVVLKDRQDIFQGLEEGLQASLQRVDSLARDIDERFRRICQQNPDLPFEFSEEMDSLKLLLSRAQDKVALLVDGDTAADESEVVSKCFDHLEDIFVRVTSLLEASLQSIDRFLNGGEEQERIIEEQKKQMNNRLSKGVRLLLDILSSLSAAIQRTGEHLYKLPKELPTPGLSSRTAAPARLPKTTFLDSDPELLSLHIYEITTVFEEMERVARRTFWYSLNPSQKLQGTDPLNFRTIPIILKELRSLLMQYVELAKQVIEEPTPERMFDAYKERRDQFVDIARQLMSVARRHMRPWKKIIIDVRRRLRENLSTCLSTSERLMDVQNLLLEEMETQRRTFWSNIPSNDLVKEMSQQLDRMREELGGRISQVDLSLSHLVTSETSKVERKLNLISACVANL